MQNSAQIKIRRAAKGMDIFFFENDLKGMIGLLSNRERRKAFCSTCTTYSKTQKEAFKSAPIFRLALFTRALQCPFVPVGPPCSKIAPCR